MADQLWRAVAVYRVAAFAYAVVLVAANDGHYARPALGWVLVAVMAAWTAVTVTAYARPSGRRTPLLAADVAVGAALVLMTLAVETQGRIDAGAPTLPAVWAAAPVLACAVAGGPVWGGASAAVVAAADLAERGAITEHTFNGIVLLLIAGFVGGYVVRLGVRGQEAIADAARREAATRERERLARDIHDSVLQVLALVARRGAALGGEAAELAALAAQQEAGLRALVSTPMATVDATGALDLRALLAALETDRVSIASPAEPVLLPEPAARAVAAAVGEAVTNASRHAGEAARTWVLVEDDGGVVTVTVRDDGVGIPSGRLEEASRGGRLGVAQSILGRVRAVGGDVTITTARGAGTEVELRVPRPR